MSPEQPAFPVEASAAFLLGAMASLYSQLFHASTFVYHTTSQHPSVKDSFVPKKIMRYHIQ